MAARGLDIPEVDLVIQCEPPKVRVERWREKKKDKRVDRRGERGRGEGKKMFS